MFSTQHDTKITFIHDLQKEALMRLGSACYV